MERAARIAVGVVALVAGAAAEALADMLRREDESRTHGSDDVESEDAELMPMLVGASLRLASGFFRTGLRIGALVSRDCAALISTSAGPPAVRRVMERARGSITELDDRWRAERAQDEHLASALVAWVAPSVVDGLLNQLDLTEIVLSHLDLDRLAEAIDVEHIAQRVDVATLADRVDVDALAARVNVEGIVRRLDLAGIALEVIEKIDLPRIMRESTGTIADETVEGIRASGVTADRALSRYLDHVLGRNGRTRGETE